VVRKTLLAVAAFLLIELGWVAGRAAQSEPDFEFIVNAPMGKTDIECIKRCKIKWVERPNTGSPATTFSFKCGPNVERCSSGTIGGWTDRQ
jgi:hypothetical protein